MSPLVTHLFFLEFAAIVACLKFEVLDDIPVLLNFMGHEIMHFFEHKLCFIEKSRYEPSAAYTEVGVLVTLMESVISAGQSLASTGLLGKLHPQIPESGQTVQFHHYCPLQLSSLRCG